MVKINNIFIAIVSMLAAGIMAADLTVTPENSWASSGIKIMTLNPSQGTMFRGKEEVTAAFDGIFAYALDHDINHIVIPKFGLISAQDFFEVAIKKYHNFQGKNGVKYTLALIAIEPAVAQEFVKNLSLARSSPTNILVAGQYNIIDVIRNVSRDSYYKEKTAFFVPDQGALFRVVSKEMAHFDPSQEPSTRINLENFFLPTSVVKGAPSVVMSMAQNLAKPDAMLLKDFPRVEVTHAGIEISNITKLNDDAQAGHSKFLEPFRHEKGYRVPFTNLPKLLSHLKIEETIEGKPTAAYLVFTTKSLADNESRYRALSEIVLGKACTEIAYDSIRNVLVDPLNKQKFISPWRAPTSGYSYEEKVIKLWLQFIPKDPVSGNDLHESMLVENHILKNVLQEPESKNNIEQAILEVGLFADVFLLRYLKIVLSSLKENNDVNEDLMQRVKQAIGGHGSENEIKKRADHYCRTDGDIKLSF